MMSSRSTLGGRAAVLFGMVGFMWVVHLVRAALPGEVSVVHGIFPRSQAGLVGILTAPFLHADFDHLISNSAPLLVLGALILLGGMKQFLIVVQLVILIAGAGTWLFGSPNSHHIGASGIVFGFIGFLLFRSFFDRRVSSFVLTAIVAFLYGGAIGLAVLPEEGISWSGHIFGFIGGFAAAKFIGSSRPSAVALTAGEKAYSEAEVKKWMSEVEEMRRKIERGRN
jgi:membrane associated rhomboid family serine protease